jgi:hypothetical protein
MESIQHEYDNLTDLQKTYCRRYQELSDSFIRKIYKDLTLYQKYQLCRYQSLPLDLIREIFVESIKNKKEYIEAVNKYLGNKQKDPSKSSGMKNPLMDFQRGILIDMQRYQMDNICKFQILPIDFINEFYKELSETQQFYIKAFQKVWKV